MSTVTVSNIQTANGSVPLTLASGNSSAAAVVVTGSSVEFTVDATTKATINTTAMYINGVQKLPVVPSASSNQVTVTQQLIMSGNVTPTILTANASAYNPDSTGIAYTIRVQANSTSNTSNTAYGPGYEPTIFGLTAGINGEIYTIQNIGAQKIILRTEDSVTETTAANRFNFPNHVVLGGFMSMEIYYDGTLQRWRMVDSVGIPFDHKYSLTKGFFAGGATPSILATADRTTYSSETTAAVVGANLSQARAYTGAAGNADKGFFSGGQTPTAVATADRTTYSSEITAAVTGANLSQARVALSAAGNADKGFFSGGYNPSNLATADRTTYSTETTAAVTGANLSQVRGGLAASGNVDKGFFSGGFNPANLATADRTTYSTETTAAVTGANLSQARQFPAAAGNIDKGFFSGGLAGTLVTADRTTYSTETTAAVTGANLKTGRYILAAAGNADKGFFSGGFDPNPVSGGSFATADRTTYSSESTAAVTGANLSQARGGLTAV